MVKLPESHIDQEFVYSVDRLQSLGMTSPRTNPIHHDMAAILRKLVEDRRLAHRIADRYTTPLLVLVPEPISGNPRYEKNTRAIPENVMQYATEISDRTHPGGSEGYFHCTYEIDAYLDRTHMVLPLPNELKGRPINPREMILFFANKLGGVHVEPDLRDLPGKKQPDAETLYLINESVSIYGEQALYQQFDSIASTLWRALAPLRDEVREALNT